MNQRSRTYNSIKNVTINFSMQILTLIASFVGRTIFINVLGNQYLGISGLYTNILSVLSLADLGITTVMTFALYKPISANDTETIKSLMFYFRKLYRWIALAIFVIGIALLPVLQWVINGSELPIQELRLYYLLFLINSVCSYLVIYKSTLISADQRIYIIKIAEFVARMTSEVAMIAVLLITGNYLLFLVLNVVITIVKNMLLSVIADRLYPFLRSRDAQAVSGETKKQLTDNIKSLFIYRVSAMIMNSTDNIIISVMLGTVIVGYYSNYLVIITALNTFIMILAQSVLSSIGSFNATSNPQKSLKIFRFLMFLFFVIGTVGASCFQTMFNDFMYLWLGRNNPEYLLSDSDLLCISINFFVGCILNPIWMYREATGIFKKTKHSMTVAAVLNIVLSIVLGKLIGLGGIVLATGISKLLTNFWYEPFVLCKDVFNSKVSNYWIYVLKMLLPSAGAVALSVLICSVIPVGIGWMLLKIIISISVSLSLFLVLGYRGDELRFLKSIVLSLLKKKGNKAIGDN